MKNNNLIKHKFGVCGKIEEKEAIKKEIIDLNARLTKMLDDIEADKLNQKLFSGVVFATFKNCKEYEAYLEIFPNSFFGLIFKIYLPFMFTNYICCCLYKAKKRKKYRLFSQLNVEKAPEPSDLKWENLRYSYMNKFFRSVIVYLVSIVLIVISLFIIVGLTQVQNDFKNIQNKGINSGLSIAISTVISIINYIMTILLKILSK
jgi:hypothetical protein